MPADPSFSRPRLPRKGGSREPQRNATFLALGGLLAAALGLTVLVTAVLTGFAPAGVVVILLIISAFGFVFGGHYLLWGIWLDRRLAARGQTQQVEFWKRAPLAPPLADEFNDAAQD